MDLVFIQNGGSNIHSRFEGEILKIYVPAFYGADGVNWNSFCDCLKFYDPFKERREMRKLAQAHTSKIDT